MHQAEQIQKDLNSFPLLELTSDHIENQDVIRVNQFLEEYNVFSKKRQIERLVIKINSSGGDLISAQEIIQSLQKAKDTGLSIYFVLKKRVFSAAFLIFLYLGEQEKSFAHPATDFLFHELMLPVHIEGDFPLSQYEEIINSEMKRVQRERTYQDSVFSLYQRRSGLSTLQLQTEMVHEISFDAEEALKRNLIAHIID